MKDIKGIRLTAMLAVWACYWVFVFWASKAPVLEGEHTIINLAMVAIGLIGAWLTYLVVCRRIDWAQEGDG